MKVLILAGGLGTRLGDLTKKTPKPMIIVNGKPFLESLILYFKKQGFSEFILSVGYFSDQIKNYFGNGGKLGVKIQYILEDTPLGTAGGIKLAEDLIQDDENLLISNGDSFVGIDFNELVQLHEEKNADITMAMIESPTDEDNEIVVSDSTDKIVDFLRRGTQENKEFRLKNKTYINAGVYIFKKKVFALIPPHQKVSLENEIFPTLLGNINFFGKKFDNIAFIDIGTPARYKKAHKILKEALKW